jgi:hypothetical protein
VRAAVEHRLASLGRWTLFHRLQRIGKLKECIPRGKPGPGTELWRIRFFFRHVRLHCIHSQQGIFGSRGPGHGKREGCALFGRAMELYAGARSAEEKRCWIDFVASMKRMSAYEVPGRKIGERRVMVELFTTFPRAQPHPGSFPRHPGGAGCREPGRRPRILECAIAAWETILTRQGDTFAPA